MMQPPDLSGHLLRVGVNVARGDIPREAWGVIRLLDRICKRTIG